MQQEYDGNNPNQIGKLELQETDKGPIIGQYIDFNDEIIPYTENGSCLVESQGQVEDHYNPFFDGIKEKDRNLKLGFKKVERVQQTFTYYYFYTQNDFNRFKMSKKSKFSFYEKSGRSTIIGNLNYREQQIGRRQGEFIEKYGAYEQLVLKGNYDNDKRIGGWVILFKGVIVGGGDYDQQGLKSGQWTDVIEHFDIEHQVIAEGEYKNGVRIGKWLISFRNSSNQPFNFIGGGNYNESGLKFGQWTEIHEYYSNDCQVIYSGEYNNDKRIGNWKIAQRDQSLDPFICIGGGEYNENGVKQNKWIEINETFENECQVTYSGEYKDGVRIGEWFTMFRHSSSDPFQVIGGGNFDQQGIKQGQWIDIHAKYSSKCQITQSGEYRNNIRIGNWTNKIRESIFQRPQCVGGGNYDENGRKIGQWVDLHVNYQNDGQIIYSGQYDDGKRTGKWTISFRNSFESPLEIIGGGGYDQKGLKEGLWIEPHDNYHDDCQVTLTQEYKDGVPIGKQIILCRYFSYELFKEIGGGSYDLQGVKQGRWNELHWNYSFHCQILYSGEYKNGIRIGKWEIKVGAKFCMPYDCIGGGNYDDYGVKQGQWIDLHENYSDCCQTIYTGEYKNGIRVGKWNVSFREYSSRIFENLYDSYYDDTGVKQGQWNDFHDNFWIFCQAVYSGVYQNGVKTGKWNILYRPSSQNDFMCVGGGDYDDKGKQLGRWIELQNNFWNDNQVIQTGDYKNGIRTGNWTISQRESENDPFEVSGGGNYDANGVKQGLWIDLHYSLFNKCQLTYNGEYSNGFRIGKWAISNRSSNSDPWQLIGHVNYDHKGVKQGRCDENQDSCRLTYSGDYNNGIRFGKWTISYQSNDPLQNIIGGGNYDNNGVKSGNWIELHNNYSDDFQMTYSGVYENGIRTGQWTISYRDSQNDPFECIGSGFYDDNGVKQGQWNDVYSNYQKYLHLNSSTCQVIQSGLYKNGTRIGKWTFLVRMSGGDKFECIGFGHYDDNGAKQGQWIDLHYNFANWNQVILSGEYQNGKRIGEWTISHRGTTGQPFVCIGGGNYDLNGVKQGQWKDLEDSIITYDGILYSGEYKNGIHIGKWVLYYIYDNEVVCNRFFDCNGVETIS